MEIIWTNEAEETFETITDYIFKNWSVKELQNFINKTDEVLNILSKHSEVGMLYKNTEFRRFLIAEQVYLIYRLENHKIYLITFWDNRQNPLNLDVVLGS